MSISDSFEKWFDDLSPDKGFGKAFLDYLKEEEKKNKIVDVEGLKVFLESTKIIKEYFRDNADIVSVNIKPINPSSNIGVISIEFRNFNIVNGKDLRNISQHASYIELVVNDKNNPEIIFGFRNLMKVIK